MGLPSSPEASSTAVAPGIHHVDGVTRIGKIFGQRSVWDGEVERRQARDPRSVDQEHGFSTPLARSRIHLAYEQPDGGF
jgi:hypothetical protein